jgi:hypothetical protein
MYSIKMLTKNKPELSRNILFIILSLLISIQVNGQLNDSACLHIREGVYYSYNSGAVFIRDQNYQKEIDMNTGDTTLWAIEWQQNCKYRLTYVSGTGRLDDYLKRLNQKFSVDVSVIKFANDYYVYKTAYNKVTHLEASSDTIWTKEQPSRIVHQNIIEASFPGGTEAWTQYMIEGVTQYARKFGRVKNEGNCLIRFVVDTDGSISDVQAISLEGSRIAKIAIDIIKKGPKWVPGSINGKPTKMAKIQPIIFQITEE